MKLLPILTLALITFQSPAAAQINRTSGDRISELGTFTANSNSGAARLCTAKGGNIAVHNQDGSYTCYFWEKLAK
jgi:hypothetical protein